MRSWTIANASNHVCGHFQSTVDSTPVTGCWDTPAGRTMSSRAPESVVGSRGTLDERRLAYAERLGDSGNEGRRRTERDVTLVVL